MVRDCYTQAGYAVRFDWGPEGADAVAPGAAFVAVVDVLSFTTTLTVAVERGIAVLPYRWRDESAHAVARAHGATLAVGRSAARAGQVSLSPGSVLRATGVERLVLPSPNGSTVAARLADAGATVVGVSLRNAAAAAAWIRSRADDRPASPGQRAGGEAMAAATAAAFGGGTVAVVAAGERWDGGPLRPAVEDLWGAGAFIAALTDGLPVPARQMLSPEARMALAAFRDVAGDLPGALAACASGRELIGDGYPDDVTLAGARTDSVAVPVLVDGWFVGAR
ncbi:2-phosphosulfolactate phosphatase [Jidongwangia harbinensis]|uniref:2-phosphosulfolactate phosphatase n=1 Tax=Jidongwangia harbinensis TaxID=2878561 RepID=UPI001CDA1F2A|nr:2-phosphosulfolactate phosphatase [Jidongwangia harbinensis]MCA2214679.1 2-phosphosulfolactate phosphatase [Jidongwangia harbinensis]